MAEKKRFFDVWILESNTVYKEVPYDKVTDWLQEGRLLEDDKGKPSGTKDWMRLGDIFEFQPYLPRVEEGRPDDQAEALESVNLDFAYKRPSDEEDDDVDMIPLIDVSLVLLVFFMLTATGVAISAPVPTPETEHGFQVDATEGVTIDINLDAQGAPVFALRVGDRPAEPEERDLVSVAAIADRLKARLVKMPDRTELVINAHKDLKARVARDLLAALQRDPFRNKISVNYYGVSTKKP